VQYQKLNLSKPSDVLSIDHAYKVSKKVTESKDSRNIATRTVTVNTEEKTEYFVRTDHSQMSQEEIDSDHEMPLMRDGRHKRTMNCSTMVTNDEDLLPSLFALTPGIVATE